MVQNDAIHTSEDYVNYTFNISSKGVGEVTGELLGLSNTVSVILGDIAFKTAEMLSHTETLAIGTGAAVGALFASATKDAIRFEQQMANVKAIGGESLNVKDIGSAAMEYSNRFGMATASMTEGLEALARAGITTTSVMKGVLEEGVKLSKLEGIDLEDSINDLISTTNLLSVENVDMNDAQYADMVKQMNQHIVSTSESAPINAQNIIQSLQHVGGYASASGMDQDDLFAVIAQLGSRGTKGEMAGTALRAFIAAGQKDTAQRALDRIGLNVRDLWDEDGNTMLSISEMKNVLDNALEARGYSKQEKLEFYSDFAGYKQANQIMKIDTTEVEHYKEQIANAWDLGHKLDTILGTVRGNLDRIWQITQNFMTKVGSKFLFIANAILTPVRMLLELINKMPFADTAVAVGMIIIGFSGMLKIINNIVPRFSGFFIQLSQSKKDALSIRSVWKKLPEDISKAKDTLAAMKDPQEMLAIQQQRQLYSKKEMEIVENRLGRVFYVESQWDDERLSDMNKEQKQEYLKNMWDQADNPARQTFINQLKVQDPEKWEKAVNDYMSRTIAHANDAASQVSYDIGDIVTNDKLTSIDRYVAWIWGFISGAPESSNDSDNTPPDASSTTTDNRQRNARINDFKNIRDSIFENKGDYGDYSYHVNPITGMRQFEYNNINAMREFEEQVKQEIERKERMYLDFLNDKDIIGGRNRLKKSLTIGAKTDLGYEFSTGANTADIKHILETGHIRSGNSKILDEQLQTIANVLETNLTGNTNNDMQRFYRILSQKENKDELLESILDKTQVQWNDKYYNNGRVGFFSTKALEQASEGVTAQKIMDKVGVSSIREVQEHFKNVDLNDTLLNECVDIMYQDKELVKTLVDEEIKYMYENLARVQNSLERASNGGAGFSSKGEDNWRRDLLNQLQEEKREQIEAQKAKAISYVLDDFNPNDFANFSSSPYDKYDLSAAIEYQNDDILYGDHHEEHLEGFQGYIYPIGGDIARSQRYGNDNFKIRNIKHVPYDDLLQENVEEVFLERHDDIGFDFMEVFADWVSEVASSDGGYWETTFNHDYANNYFESYGDDNYFKDGKEIFNELKQELEEIYRAYIDLCAYGAQSLIEASPLYDSTLSYRGGRLYTPENNFGAFDTITSTSLVYGVAQDFWNENPNQRSILEIYSPEDIPAIIAHTDILNSSNKHLWSRERELTLASGQPYLHIPNPDGFEKRLLMLTIDQQDAVKEIMGEDFEFQKNSPSATFLSAGESLSSDDILMNRFAALLNKEALTKDNMGAKLQDLLMNGAISVDPRYTSGALGGTNSDDMIDINTGTIRYHTDNYHNEYGDYANALLDTVLHEMTHVLMMHQERLDYHNNNIPSELGIDNFKTSQLIHGYDEHFVAEYEAQYVSSQVLSRLGIETSEKNQKRMAAFKDVIEQKGYGDQIQYEILDSLVDEMLNNISIIGKITGDLSTQINKTAADITIPQIYEEMRPIMTKIQAFNKDAAIYQGPAPGSKKDEVDQILSDMAQDMNKLQLDLSKPTDLSRIYNAIAQKYTPYIESLDDIYDFDTYFKYALRKSSLPVDVGNFRNEGEKNAFIEALQNAHVLAEKEYGPKSKQAEQIMDIINQTLNTASNGDNLQLIKHLKAEQQERIENAFKNVNSHNDITKPIFDSWFYFKFGEGKNQYASKLSLEQFYNHIEEEYDKETSNKAKEWIKNASQNTDNILSYKNTGISMDVSNIPDIINKWHDKRKQIAGFDTVDLPDAGVSVLLPIHQQFADSGYTYDKKGNIDSSVAQKYMHKHSANDARSFFGVVDLFDTDFIRTISDSDKLKLEQAIVQGEKGKSLNDFLNDISSLMDSDGKLGEGWAALNITTAMDCMGRLEDGSCAFCDACYAFGQAARLPEQAIKQIAKSILFATTSTEQFASIIKEQGIEVVRFNQEGDFRNVDDYKRTAEIAELAAAMGLETRFYGYTKNKAVIEHIKKHGSPDNYQMNDSLDTSTKKDDTSNYTAAAWEDVLKYLKDGYLLCEGACEDCKKCLANIDKVTILRNGSNPLGVDQLAHLNHKGHIAVFEKLMEQLNSGGKVSKAFAKKTIKEIEQHPEFVKHTQGKIVFKSQGEESIDDLFSQAEKARKYGKIRDDIQRNRDREVKPNKQVLKFLKNYREEHKDTFQSAGEFNDDKRLPELMDWAQILAQHGDVSGIGYGVNKNNMLDFLSLFHDKIITEDNFRQREGMKSLPKGYRGDRMVLSGKEFFDSEFNIRSVKSRLENFGIYWNKKSAKEAEETGIEELINLFDKEAVKEALMREIITTNQLKKWHKQLQNSRAADKYGEVPWTLEDIEDWDTQKKASDVRLQALIEQKKQQKKNKSIEEDTVVSFNSPFVMNKDIREWVEKDYEPSQTVSENVKKSTSSQTTLDDFVTPSDNPSKKEEREKNQNIRKLLNSLVINQGQRGIIQKLLIEGRSKDIVKEIQKANRDTSEEDIVDVVKYLINSPAKLNDIKINPEESFDTPETPPSSLYEQHEKYIHNPELNKQNQEKNNVFVEYNYWEKLRQRVSQALNFAPPGTEDKQNKTEKKAQKTIFSLIDLGEKGENFTASILGNLAQKMNNGEAYDGDVFKDTSKSFSKMIGPAKEFASILDRLSEDFIFLTPVAEGFNAAVNKADTAIDVLTAMSQFLGVTRENEGALDDLKKESKENPYAKMLYSVTKLKDSKTKLGQNAWALIQGATNKANSYIGQTLIPMLPTLVPLLLPIIAIIGAIIVAIKAVQFWEKKHAQALKESQEALKEATTKTSTALSQYKDFHKARERETDIIKKQQAARKEAIALYELEIARLNQQKAVKKESDIRNDKIWGEYGVRAEYQKMSWTKAILLGPFAMISKWLSGDFESQYENYDGTTKNIRQIKESTLGSILRPTGAKGKVAGIYDDNKLFFSMVEAYQKPLIELYNKESKLIEQYGSLDNARTSEEFYNAVQEFADATGIQGETAGKMLDWLETENKVNQATQAMQTQVNLITSKAHAKAMAAEYNDVDFASDNLRNAMIYAQADQIYKDAYNEMWWEWFSASLFGILYTIINTITLGLTYGKERKEYAKKQKAYNEAMKELQEMGVQGLAEIGENTAEHAERRDYGTSVSLYNDKPFEAALESAALQYAEKQQQNAFNKNHIIYSENEYKAIQENYLNYGPEANMELHDIIRREKEYVHQESEVLQKSLNQDMTEASQAGVEGFKEGLDQHSPGAISKSIQDEMIYSQTFIDEATPQLSENMYNLGTEMSDNHKNALLIANNTEMEMVDSDASVIVATPFLAHSASNLGVEMSDSHKESLVIADNTRMEMVNVNDTIEESKEVINPTAYDAGYEAGQEYSKGFKEGLQDLYDQISTPEALKESLKEHILYRQGLAKRPTDTNSIKDDAITIQKPQQKAIQELTDIGTNAINQAIKSQNNEPSQYRSSFLAPKDIDTSMKASYNIQPDVSSPILQPPAEGFNGMYYELIEGRKDPAMQAFYTLRRLIYGIASLNDSQKNDTNNQIHKADTSSSSITDNDDELKETAIKSAADTGSFILDDVIELGGKFVEKIVKTIIGYGTKEGLEQLSKTTGKSTFKTAGKSLSKAAPYIGPLVTAGFAVAEHNPLEKHYNEDGSEKRAFQATGEVVGETAGAVVAAGLGLAVEGALTSATFGVGALPAAIIGGIVETAASLILEPIGEAVGGTIGWVVDEVVNTKFTDMWDGINETFGGIPGQIVESIEQSPIGEAGHWVFSQLDNLTGGWLGDTWEYVKNSSIAELTGLDQLGGALQGLGEWLFGGGEESQQLPTPDQITDEQIMELEQAGMLDEYLATYGLDKEQTNILNQAKAKVKPIMSNGSTVIIKNININTEDDPEKIKSALMNLIIEMQEQVNPRQVSRTVGEPPAVSNATTDQNTNSTPQAEGTNPQSGTPNGNSTTTNTNTSPNTNT